MEIIFVIFGILLHFLPVGVAMWRDHPNFGAIAIINIFLGWTFLGWVIALAMASSLINKQ